MNKAELAAYLASLLTILEHEDKSAIGRSPWIAEEFDKSWAAWKHLVENDDETGNRNQPTRRSKTGTDQSRSVAGSSLSDRRD